MSAAVLTWRRSASSRDFDEEGIGSWGADEPERADGAFVLKGVQSVFHVVLWTGGMRAEQGNVASIDTEKGLLLL